MNTVIQARNVATKITGARSAHVKVCKAVERGDLPPVTTCCCVDCGDPAQAYDHRDYARPLDVEPVCDSCNVRRGKALPNPSAAKAYKAAVIEYERDWKSRMPEPNPLPDELIADCRSFRDAVYLAWEMRSTRNMTRAALAERVGIHPPHITEVLSAGESKGKRSLHPEQIDDFEWAVGNRAVTQYLVRKAGLVLRGVA
ncbi:hypothetical protein P3T40_003428 [Paraburkholderia sp. EB58]|uniref:helix-turn-helix domain-containing protein n=1 Tax=Paraburkholderia sp. EB58 TaxID=3035125 RepID=UPI003D253073